MPRSLGFGLSKHHEACHGVWPNQPISAPPGTCSWPSKAQPVLDPACPWLPVRSWPAPRLLSRGLLPSTPAGKTSPRPKARRPNAHGSRLPVAASRPAPQPAPQLHGRRRARGQGPAYPRERQSSGPRPPRGAPGPLGSRSQPRGLPPVRPCAGPTLARGALPTWFLLPHLSARPRHLLQTRDEPSPDPAPRDLSPGTHRPSCLTHPSRLRSLRLGGGRSGSFSGSFGRQYGGSAGRRPDRDKHLHRTKRVLNPHAPFPPGDDTLMGMLLKRTRSR